MAKDKELNMDQLEAGAEATATETTKAKKAKKEMTPEEKAELKASLEAGVAKIREFGVSAEFDKVLNMVPVWADTAEAAPVKEEVIAAFEGSEKFKDYIEGAFNEERAVFAGMQKAVSVINLIYAFYARREGKAKEKTQQISIDGKLYFVSQNFLAEVKADTSLSAEDRRAKLLNHPVTKEVESVETL